MACDCLRCLDKRRCHTPSSCNNSKCSGITIQGDTGSERLYECGTLRLVGSDDVDTDVTLVDGSVMVTISVGSQQGYTFNVAAGANTTTINNTNTLNVVSSGYESVVNVSPVIGGISTLTIEPQYFFLTATKRLQEQVSANSTRVQSEFIVTENSVMTYDESDSRFYLGGEGFMNVLHLSANVATNDDFLIIGDGSIGMYIEDPDGNVIDYAQFNVQSDDIGRWFVGKQTLNLTTSFRGPEYVRVVAFNNTNTNLPMLLETPEFPVEYPNMRISIQRYAM